MDYIYNFIRLFLPCFIFVFLLPGRAAHAQVIQIGNGTDTSNGAYYPVSNFQGWGVGWGGDPESMRFQFMYTAEEMRQRGVTGPQMLDSLAWQVSSAYGVPLPSYTVRVKNTASDFLAGIETDGFVQVYQNPALTINDTGWFWIPFQTPFFWNGFDNILFDICWQPVTSPAANADHIQKCYFDEFENSYGLSRLVSWAPSGSSICNVTEGSDLHFRYNTRLGFSPAPACSGTPSMAGITPAGPLTLPCAGAPLTLRVAGTPQAGGVTYVWEQSKDGITWENINANPVPVLQTSPVESVKYRLRATCLSSQSEAVSAEVQVNVTSAPVYKALPYTQDFESWMNGCNTLDLPDENWTVYPSHGMMSWRREDQGAHAGWEDVVPNYYNPVASLNSHSARIQTSKGEVGETGDMSVYIDASQSDSGKLLRFDYFNKTSSPNELRVYLSTNGGASFERLLTAAAQSVHAAWEQFTVPFKSVSPNTVIRFEAFSTGYQWGDFDTGIDNVRIFPSCDGKPDAGPVVSETVCRGSGLKLDLGAAADIGGLVWRWQESDGITWTDLPNGAEEAPTVALAKPTWYRAIITCKASGESDTSELAYFVPKPEADCYCESGSRVAAAGHNIGNVIIRNEVSGTIALDNGNPLPLTGNPDATNNYGDFSKLAPVQLYKDSTYKLKLTFFTSYAAPWANPPLGRRYVKVFVDYDRNGAFDASELVFSQHRMENEHYDSFVLEVPSHAKNGDTRMRIVSNELYFEEDSATVLPCGIFDYGETEDYTLRIIESPCNGSERAGYVSADDTIFCPGYPVTLTLHDRDTLAGPLTYRWQSSVNNGADWTDLPDFDNMTRITRVFEEEVSYRVHTLCLLDERTQVYSGERKLEQYELCYCASYADGWFSGLADSSDIGGISLGNIRIPLSGGHLNNETAVNRFTNHTITQGVLELYADSTYELTLSHILKSATHADSRLSIYMDLNADGVYDADELLYSGVSGATAWRMSGPVHIPADAVLDKVTGVRFIIRDDVTAAEEPCGLYHSGETEDFLVKFMPKPLSVKGMHTPAQNMDLYPNPASGDVHVRYRGAAAGETVVTLSSITGQTVKSITIPELSDGMIIRLDLRTVTPGVYFVKLASGNSVSLLEKLVIQ